jgi:hypothetical protein
MGHKNVLIVSQKHWTDALHLNAHNGKVVNPGPVGEDGLTAQVVKTLMKDHKNKGRVVYMDNFYSSICLFKDLRQNGIGACGIVHTNRKWFSAHMKGGKMKRGELPRFCTSHDNEMLAFTWQDTRRV